MRRLMAAVALLCAALPAGASAVPSPYHVVSGASILADGTFLSLNSPVCTFVCPGAGVWIEPGGVPLELVPYCGSVEWLGYAHRVRLYARVGLPWGPPGKQTIVTDIARIDVLAYPSIIPYSLAGIRSIDTSSPVTSLPCEGSDDSALQLSALGAFVVVP